MSSTTSVNLRIGDRISIAFGRGWTGNRFSLPINLDTVNRLYGLNLTSFELEQFFASVAEPRSPARTSEDVIVGKVGRELYNRVFRNYTRKQVGSWIPRSWKRPSRRAFRFAPIATTGDFTDTYQAMPLHGFTRMFDWMLSHPNIKVMLNTDYHEIDGVIPYEEMVYTGPIDEFFDYRFGNSPTARSSSDLKRSTGLSSRMPRW